MITVTKPFLPPIHEYEEYVRGIWNRNWLTNRGPLVKELELNLKGFLGIDQLLYVTNGTIALQFAIKALKLKGEIITTPFSFIATTSAIVWENCTPVFADIDSETFNISPDSIEKLITEDTSAILATHVYGNPCEVEEIDRIAKKYNLKVIYDGAHAFGVKYKGKSIFEYGDVSITSFHATKLFHTIEGGAIFTKSTSLMKKMNHMKNFGHDGPENYVEIGINGKNSEFHAAMGICNLKYIDAILEKRKSDYNLYSQLLKPIKLQHQKIHSSTIYNYSYYPIVFNTEQELIEVQKELNSKKIFARRYFYPTLDKAEYIELAANIPVAKDIASRVLCLPLYYDLIKGDIDLICSLIINKIKNTG